MAERLEMKFEIHFAKVLVISPLSSSNAWVIDDLVPFQTLPDQKIDIAHSLEYKLDQKSSSNFDTDLEVFGR